MAGFNSRKNSFKGPACLKFPGSFLTAALPAWSGLFFKLALLRSCIFLQKILRRALFSDNLKMAPAAQSIQCFFYSSQDKEMPLELLYAVFFTPPGKIKLRAPAVLSFCAPKFSPLPHPIRNLPSA